MLTPFICDIILAISRANVRVNSVLIIYREMITGVILNEIWAGPCPSIEVPHEEDLSAGLEFADIFFYFVKDIVVKFV
jgi:hypothetical protein